MATSQLNKKLFTDINRLKLLNKSDSRPRFILNQSPFDEDDDDNEQFAAASRKDTIIAGQIFPDSAIYNQGSFQIEMKLTPTYPLDPPEVRFITPIYHPNVARDGKFCCELLQKNFRWMWTTPLVEIVKHLVHYVDHPNIDFSASFEMGSEYMQNKSEFDRKAMKYVKMHALPRF